MTTRDDFPAELPDKNTAYCWHCGQPTVRRRGKKRARFFCESCGRIASRVRVYDPAMVQYFDDQQRLVHESCGIFILNPRHQVLLVQRTRFPYLLTIPAGHLEVGEDPKIGAIRETEEEVGVHAHSLEKVFEGDIVGDTCLGGADIHKWNAYVYRAPENLAITLDEEGSAWGWYDVDGLAKLPVIQPIVYMVQQGIRLS